MHFGIRSIAYTIEVIEDVKLYIDMAHTARRLEQGYILGKASINTTYYFYGIYLLYVYYSNGYDLITEEESYARQAPTKNLSHEA